MKQFSTPCILLMMLVSVMKVRGQGCPPNTAMGLCEPVANPCFSDNECFNGEICCPVSCSRSCKPRAVGPAAFKEAGVPDLLNDPRVYVGKCPDSSCYNMFGGDPNQCSTSNLCSKGHYCCNDGCKNVCLMTPEYAALVAEQEARVRKQQSIIIQKHQQEMRRKQNEMLVQKQRQLATAEQARKRAEARAAAEAELAAMQTRAKYEENLRAAAVAQSRSGQQQRFQVKQQPRTDTSSPLKPAISAQSSSSSTFLDNFSSDSVSTNVINSPNLQPELQQPSAPVNPPEERSGYFGASSKDSLAGSLTNQINSPANPNPYSSLNQLNKDPKSDLLSLIQTPTNNNVETSITNENLQGNIYSQRELSKVNPAQPSPFTRPQNPNSVPMSSVPASRSSQPQFPSARSNVWQPSQGSSYQLSARQANQPSSFYLRQASQPSSVYFRQPNQPFSSYLGQPSLPSSAYFGQPSQPSSSYLGQPSQNPADSFMMYHAIQTAA